jgi:hypothetical protein
MSQTTGRARTIAPADTDTIRVLRPRIAVYTKPTRMSPRMTTMTVVAVLELLHSPILTQIAFRTPV